MRVSVINYSERVRDAEVEDAIAAVNQQIAEHFARHWHAPAQLARVDAVTAVPEPGLLNGDGAIFICDDPTSAPVELGYHDHNGRAVPYGFVFTTISDSLRKAWTIAFSHEVLELLADPQINTLRVGPHPTAAGQSASYLQEICDPVQNSTYLIGEIEVSNFVTPSYYQVGAAASGTNHLGPELELVPFGLLPGGYVDYVDSRGAKQRFGPAAMKVLKARVKVLGALRRAQRHAAIVRTPAKRTKTTKRTKRMNKG